MRQQRLDSVRGSADHFRVADWFSSFFDRRYVGLLARQKPAAVTRAEVDFVVAALGLVRGQRVLDVGCGFARHAGELARRGFHVVGLDLSRAMLREARRRYPDERRLTLVRGDMRALRFDREFDAVLSMFNALGYFSPRQNTRVLASLARALVPRGQLLIEHRNAAWDARHFAGANWWQTGPGQFVLQEGRFDHARQVATFDWRLVMAGERRVRRRVATVCEFDAAGWRAQMRGAGLRFRSACDGFTGKPVSADSGPRIIVVGQRPGSELR